MAKHRESQPAPLASIDAASLQVVTGGRYYRAGGPDPTVIAGIKQLAEVVTAVGSNIAQAKTQSSAQMMQMMQQMMQARGGR